MPTALVTINIMIINLARNLCVHEYDIFNGSAAVVLPYVFATVHVRHTLGVHSVNGSGPPYAPPAILQYPVPLRTFVVVFADPVSGSVALLMTGRTIVKSLSLFIIFHVCVDWIDRPKLPFSPFEKSRGSKKGSWRHMTSFDLLSPSLPILVIILRFVELSDVSNCI